jgi:hypothetical protein
MKSKIFLSLLLLVSFSGFSQHHQGVGIRLGEPIAVTYKRYLPANKALEFMLGTAPTRFAKSYYSNSFEERYDDYDYVSHSLRNIIYIQGRYQFHYQIPTDGIEGKLDWYWGIGAAFKSASASYRYVDESLITQEVFELRRTDIDLGPEGMLGLEFTMQNAPFTVLAEMSTFLELADRTTVRVLAGIGIRANF